MSTGSGLTEEQKLKIQENRRKALALRAARQQQQANNNNIQTSWNTTTKRSVLPVSSNLTPFPSYGTNCHSGTAVTAFSTKPKTTVSIQLSSTASSGLYGASNLKNRNTVDNFQTRQSPFSASSGKRTSSTAHYVSPQESQTGSSVQVTKGTCVLTSRNRFLVDVPYHAALIALFKTVPSKQYGEL